jgi:hypothetical protein
VETLAVALGVVVEIVYIEVGRVHAWQAVTRPTVRHEVVNRLAVIIVLYAGQMVNRNAKEIDHASLVSRTNVKAAYGGASARSGPHEPRKKRH